MPPAPANTTPRPLLLLNRLEETLIASLIAGCTLVIFAAVVQRYALGALADLVRYAKGHDWPTLASLARGLFDLVNVRLTWAQEAAIFMMIWMAKFGAAYGVRTGIHVGVDLLVERASPPLRRSLVLIAMLAGALFTGVVAVLGAHLVWHIAQSGTTSAVMEAPMWLVYLAIPLGSLLMCFRFLEVAWNFWLTGERPHHDAAAVEGVGDTIPDGPATHKDGRRP